jgi:hypothetical protein
MSFLKSKHSGWSADGRRTPYMGGGGGGTPGPTTNYTQTSNIPAYAEPYVHSMLGATQKQMFTIDDANQVTGFQPYVPYSQNVNDYVAGFSPLQQQAQQSSYGLQTPGQFAPATGLAAASGLGSLGAGQQYLSEMQNPAMMQSFMSPYQQNVTDVAKAAAVREAQMAQNAQNLGSARQGTYGGARQTLAQAERERNLLSNLSNIQAQGSQAAFDKAVQSRQFGANLGMQGFGQAGQAASTLGGLGASQLAAQQGIINTQTQQGAAQQAQEQRKIDQAIQDYAIQQQYPLMQLGFMSNMLRGLPMQSQTTQMYQAQPTTLQQGIGLLGAGASLMGTGRAEGGTIKMAEGGLAGYKYGGAIPEPKLESMADNLSVQQLQERIKDPALTPGERQVFQEALASKQRMSARSEGIAAAGGGLFNTMGYAGGGILAFDDGGEVEHFDDGGSAKEKERSAFQQDLIDMFGYSGAREGRPEMPEWMKKGKDYFTKPREKTTLTPGQLDAMAAKQGVYAEGSPALPEGMPPKAPVAAPAAPSVGATGSQASGGGGSKEASSLGGILAGLRKEGPQGELGSSYLEKLKALESGADQRMSRADKIAMAKGFLKFGSTAAPGGIGQAAVAGLGEYTDQYGKAIESDEKFRMENAKLQADIENLRRAEERGDVKLASEIRDKIEDRANRLQTANISAAATGRAGDREDKAIQQIMKEKNVGYTEALQLYKRAGLNVENTDIARQKAADAALAGNIAYMRLANSKKPEEQQQAAQIRQQVYGQYGIGAGGIGGSQTTAVGSGNLVQNKDGSFNYVPK